MKELNILITGGTGGIGKQTAISLAKHGANVIVSGRNQESGENTIKEIRALSNNNNISFISADLSNIAGINKLTDEYNTRFDSLDILINNAGLANNKYELNADGFESNFATNAIAPFLLTHNLYDTIKKGKAQKVITLMGGDQPKILKLDNLESEKSFDGLNTYSQTKMAMFALMYHLSQIKRDNELCLNICYPGQASTSMTQGVTKEMLPKLMRPLFPLFKILTKPDGGKSAAKASRSSVYLATSEELKGKNGLYIDKNCKIVEIPIAVQNIEIRNYLYSYVMEKLNSKGIKIKEI